MSMSCWQVMSNCSTVAHAPWVPREPQEKSRGGGVVGFSGMSWRWPTNDDTESSLSAVVIYNKQQEEEEEPTSRAKRYKEEERI